MRLSSSHKIKQKKIEFLPGTTKMKLLTCVSFGTTQNTSYENWDYKGFLKRMLSPQIIRDFHPDTEEVKRVSEYGFFFSGLS